MATHKIYEGDSLWLDIEADTDEITAVDSIWSNFTGAWEIKPTLGTVPATASGTLTRTDTVGKFRFNLDTVNSALCLEGNYYIIFEINNISVDYKEEIHDRLVVMAQGITP